MSRIRYVYLVYIIDDEKSTETLGAVFSSRKKANTAMKKVNDRGLRSRTRREMVQ